MGITYDATKAQSKTFNSLLLAPLVKENTSRMWCCYLIYKMLQHVVVVHPTTHSFIATLLKPGSSSRLTVCLSAWQSAILIFSCKFYGMLEYV